MDFEKIEKKDKKYIAPTYNRFALAIESGEGATVTDASGRKYVDFTSGIGVNIFGMNDEAWKSTACLQSVLYAAADRACRTSLQKIRGEEGLFRQFGGGSQRMCDKGGAKIFRTEIRR